MLELVWQKHSLTDAPVFYTFAPITRSVAVSRSLTSSVHASIPLVTDWSSKYSID